MVSVPSLPLPLFLPLSLSLPLIPPLVSLLSFWLLNMSIHKQVKDSHTLPLSPKAKLEWLGYVTIIRMVEVHVMGAFKGGGRALPPQKTFCPLETLTKVPHSIIHVCINSINN